MNTFPSFLSLSFFAGALLSSGCFPVGQIRTRVQNGKET